MTDKTVTLSRKQYIHILFIVVLCLIIYSNTFHVPFFFDDESSIVQNNVIKSLDNFLLNSNGYNHSPMRFIGYLTFALNYKFGGLHVTGYHIFNLAVHIINALLVYALVVLTCRTPYFMDQGAGIIGEKTFDPRFLAVFTALLFASHPVQTQAVTYIVQRLTSLATMFYLLSLIFFIKFRFSQESIRPSKGKTLSFYFLMLVMIILAMKTKEIAFTLPIVIVLYEFFFFRITTRRNLLIFVPILLTLLIIPLVLLSINRPIGEVLSDVTDVTNVEQEITRWDYLLTQFSVIATYIRLLFLPVNLNLDYDYPIYHSFFSPRVLFSFLFLLCMFLGAIALFIKSRKGSDPGLRLISFGIAWFFITLSVESTVIPLRDVIYEHRVYLPSVGFLIAAVAGVMIVRGAEGKISVYLEKSLIPIVGAVVLVFSVATFSRNMVWQDDVRFWEDVVKKSPGKARPYHNLGLAFYKKGRLEDAIRNYQMSLKIYPNSFKAHNVLGVAYVQQGRFEEAIRELQTAVRLDPDYAEAYYNLGNIYGKEGRFEEAIRELQTAVRLDPDYAKAYDNLGLIFTIMNRFEDALVEFRTALNINPDAPNVRFNLGTLYLKMDRVEESIQEYLIAVKLQPDFTEARNNLGTLYAKLGRLEEAISEFQTNIQINPDDARAHYNIALLYRAQGRNSEALREFQIAERLKSLKR